MVGLASAAVAAKVVGASPSPQLWLGAVVASGLPDLDLVLAAFGLSGPRFHRNASHSLLVIAALAAGIWLLLPALPVTVSAATLWVWVVVLVSHPVVDVVTTGPELAARSYGIPLFWPLVRKRWFLERPILDTADFSACRSLHDVWAAVRPELLRLGPASAVVFALALAV